LNELCTPGDGDGKATIGIDVLVNGGDDVAVISSVELPESAVDIQLVDAYVVPVHFNLVGVRSGFPPDPAELDPTIEWDQKLPAAGAGIPPGETRDPAWNLVLGLQISPSADRGMTGGVEVTYSEGGRQYIYVVPTSMEVRRGTCIEDS
jgi:hypothetical protein